MNRFTTRNVGTISRRKLEAVLDAARDDVRQKSDVYEILSSIFSSVNTFYNRLREPVTEPLVLHPNDTRDADEYERFLKSVRHDLNILFDESRDATRALSETFNFVTSITDKLKFRVQRLAGMAEDLALLGDTNTSNTFVAGDRFGDDSRIDAQHQSVATPAEVAPSGGAVTLRRRSTVNVVDRTSSVELEVNDGFTYDPTSWIEGATQDKPNKQYRVHEGRYFAFIGRQEPSGGILRWTTRHVNSEGREVEPGLYGTDADTNENVEPLEDTETVVLPDTPTVEELQNMRRRMFDQNPSTYWQIEATYNPFEVLDEEGFREEYADATPTQRAQAFRQLVADNETRDFEVTLIVDLTEPRVINWINLNPENFGDDEYLEVLAIDTALTPDGPWIVIEGLFDHRYENTLTPEANEELTDAEVSATLTPSRYQYAGQGVWQFAPREARFVRMTLRQKTPVPSPYEVIRYKLTRDVSTTRTKTRKRGLFD